MDTITGCWDQEGDARLTPSCVLNRLKRMGGGGEGVIVPPQQKPSSHEHYSVEIVDDDYHEQQQQSLQQQQKQQQGFQELNQDVKTPLVTNVENT